MEVRVGRFHWNNIGTDSCRLRSETNVVDQEAVSVD